LGERAAERAAQFSNTFLHNTLGLFGARGAVDADLPIAVTAMRVSPVLQFGIRLSIATARLVSAHNDDLSNSDPSVAPNRPKPLRKIYHPCAH